MRKTISFWAIVCTVFSLDQLTKYIISKNMTEGTSISLIPNIFHLTYILNPGAAFGIFAYKTSLFILLSLLALGLIVIFQPKIMQQSLLVRIAIALQLSGALGNLLDRLRTGYVVDFFDFRIWPIFNIADIAIVTGVAIFFWQIVFKLEKNEGKANGKI